MIAKMFLVLFFLLLYLQPVHSQSGMQENLSRMSVIGAPEKLDFEIVTKKDANNRFCAGIKVVSDMDGFRYDAYNGVVGMKDNPGEDLVYIQPDERVLEVYHSGYEPLKLILSDMGIQLHPKEVWQIKIKGAPQRAALLPVSIIIQPPQATLFIDGQKMDGPSPYSLSRGAHQITIKKKNYKTHEQSITVDEKNVLFNIKLKEVEDIPVQIESVPGGANVYLDGLLFGKTPLSKFYPEGVYPIQIKKEGYETIVKTIKVKAPKTRLSFTLTENVGFLKINTHPSATVYMDDKKILANKEIKVTPRIAHIRVTTPKAIPMEKQVIVKKNEHLEVDLYPYFPKGTIQVAVTPFDAKIELRGDAGEFYQGEGAKDFKDIPTGIYKLKVSKSGYKSHSETIRLAENDKAQRSIKLEQKSGKPTYSSRRKTTTRKKPVFTSAVKSYKRTSPNYFGLQAGVGFANNRKMEDLKVKSNAGVSYGMLYNVGFSGILSLQMEMNFFQRKMDPVYDRDSLYFENSITVSILQIPLLLKANFPNAAKPTFALYAGPSFNYFGKEKIEYEQGSDEVQIKRWELSYPMGLAFYLGKFIIDLRYEYGSRFLGEASGNISKRSDLFVILGYRF